MNKFENMVYNIVKTTPWVKYLLRNIYQNIFDLLPRKDEYFSVPYDYKEGYFFGFHDVDPFSADCSKLLANHNDFDFRMPMKEDGLQIGFFDIYEAHLGAYHVIDISYAWNYHKGCRLQWISDNKIIFNSTINNRLIAKIIDIRDKKTEIINYPIDSISPDGSFATSFSYERLERCMPGYGYAYKDDGHLNNFASEETGLFIVNIKENKRKLLVSTFDLMKSLDGTEYSCSKYLHYVTHSAFSKDGRFISFLHRWTGKDIQKLTTRVIIYDLQTSSFFVLPTHLTGSHYVWNSNNLLIVSCEVNNQICHVLFDVNCPNDYKIVAPEKLNSDGHQSFIDADTFITDTYPDKNRMVQLYKVSIKDNDVKRIASIYSPKNFQTISFYKHIACDTHPRVSKNGRYLCFDSPRTGKRSIYVMDLNKCER
jgi:hypothetical protein